MDPVDRAIKVLNQAIELDKEAITALLFLRVSCNEDLANHDTIQVLASTHKNYQVGVLGIINGILGINGDYGPVAASFDKNKNLIEFKRLSKITFSDG